MTRKVGVANRQATNKGAPSIGGRIVNQTVQITRQTMRSTKTRLFSTAILLTGMMTLFSSCPLVGVVFVDFNDPALEAIVKDKLGLRLTPVTSADMLGLVSLDISGVGVSDLTGLGYALNLRFLDASNNPISSLIPIVTCVSLRTLDLEDTDVFEISPLTSLTNLNLVNLCGDAVPNIQPLIDNTGMGAGDTVTVDCELIFGPTPNAQRMALAAKGVAVFLCGDCDSTSGTPILSLTNLDFGDEVHFDTAGVASKSFNILNGGDGTLIWGIDVGTLPTWITGVGATGGTTTTETEIITVDVDATALPSPSDVTHTLNIVSNGGSDIVVVHVLKP